MSPIDHIRTPPTAIKHLVSSADGTEINVWEVACGSANTPISKRPAVILVHGGGFVTGGLRGPFNAASFWPKQLPQYWLQESGIVCLYVEYRLAYDIKKPIFCDTHPFPKPYEDVYSTLLWANQNAGKLGIDDANISVMGFSAGGCLALTAAVKAKDEKLNPPLAKLVLVYPMLDADTEWKNQDSHSESLTEKVDKKTMRFGWDQYLKGWEASEEKKYAKPLLMNLAGLPATYLDVGTKDYFYEEVTKFKVLLERAGINTVYHEWDSMRHAFEQQKEQSAEHAEVVREAQTRRLTFIMGAKPQE